MSFCEWLREELSCMLGNRTVSKIMEKIQNEHGGEFVYIHAKKRMIDLDCGKTVVEIAKKNGVSRQTIYRHIRKRLAKNKKM